MLCYVYYVKKQNIKNIQSMYKILRMRNIPNMYKIAPGPRAPPVRRRPRRKITARSYSWDHLIVSIVFIGVIFISIIIIIISTIISIIWSTLSQSIATRLYSWDHLFQHNLYRHHLYQHHHKHHHLYYLINTVTELLACIPEIIL